MVLIRYLSVCALLGLSVLAHAQIVECVDANGKKSYAQSCPDGAKQREIQALPALVKPSATNAASDASKKSREDQEKAFAKRRQERLDAQAKEAEQEKKRAEAAAQCAEATRRLGLLESSRQAAAADRDARELAIMDQDLRQAEIDGLHAKIRETCQ
jgi:hypothetical protein